MKRGSFKKTNCGLVSMRKKRSKKDVCSCKNNNNFNCGGGVYGAGFLGAAIYYISVASGFWAGVLGVLKAIIWPVFLVFEMLKFLGA